MIAWIVIIIVIIIVLFFLDREIYSYEGIHIGPRLQAWLYDRWAKKYDQDKQASQKQDIDMLARPLFAKLPDVSEPLILDVATGTGRLPFALMSQSDFNGRIIAMDISHGMLRQAANKLAPYRERITLMQYERLPLPFPNEAFDVVSCVEGLELIGEKQYAVKELARVLRPGGILLTSRGTEESGRGVVVISAETLTALLHDAGFEEVEITPWWRVFNRVFARKPGVLIHIDNKFLKDILRCPQCGGEGNFVELESTLSCQKCNRQIKIDRDGIAIL